MTRISILLRTLVPLVICVALVASLLVGCASSAPPAPPAEKAAPQAQAPKAEAPKAEAPKVEAPKAEAPKTEAKPAAQEPKPAAKVGSVKVGVMGPFSGPAAPIGGSAKKGIDLANDYINAQGGIKALGGAKIEIIYSDHEGKPDLTISQMERLNQEGVVAVIGSLLSATTVVSTQSGEKLQIPQIVPLGIADVITQRGFKYTFRTTVTSDWFVRDQIKFVDYLVKEKGQAIKKVALLYEDTEYGQSTAKAWKKYLEKGGYEVISDLSYPAGSKDVTAVISKLKSANPDVTLQTSYLADALLIAKTMDQLGFKKLVIGTGAGHVHPDFRKNLGPIAENLMVVALWNPDLPSAQDVLKEFAKKYPDAKPDQEFSVFYQSLLVLKEAIEKAGKADREAIRDALTKLDYTKPMILPYERIKFGADGQNMEANVSNVIAQVQGGELVTVWPEKYATKKLILK